MATEKEQAQAEVYRMEQDVRSARDQVSLRESQLAGDKDNPIRKGNVATAKNALKNAERALDIARDRLRRI
jgi:hypothetical protein